MLFVNVLKNETINIHNERQQQAKEMTFSNLTPQEENRLYTFNKQYEGEERQNFQVAGKKVSLKLLVEAMKLVNLHYGTHMTSLSKVS